MILSSHRLIVDLDEAVKAEGRKTVVHFKIRHGPWLSGKGAPVQEIEDSTATYAALLGMDCPGVRPAFEVAEGDSVRVGQTLFKDRKRPEITFVAPLSGRVTAIDHGPRRTLSVVVIERGDGVAEEKAGNSKPIDGRSDSAVREALLACGLWPAFRTRPFGHIPAPDAQPAAIFVTATKGSPLAPDPHVVLDGKSDAFSHGVELLTHLTDGFVHVCQGEGKKLFQSSADRVRTAFFSGSSASGFAGTHINRLHPVGPGRELWTIGYQDVIAVGHLFQTGRYMAERVVALAGNRIDRPRLIRTALGARIRDVARAETTEAGKAFAAQFLSGNELTGCVAAYLGRYHQQITVIDKPANRSLRTRLSGLFSGQGALVATGALETALALDVLPVPLMRALSVGDSEAAQHLGCLEMLEEDVAILSRLCTSGADYGTLLRQVLDELAEDAA